jgi:hypothetical protein
MPDRPSVYSARKRGSSAFVPRMTLVRLGRDDEGFQHAKIWTQVLA